MTNFIKALNISHPVVQHLSRMCFVDIWPEITAEQVCQELTLCVCVSMCLCGYVHMYVCKEFLGLSCGFRLQELGMLITGV